jgi:hypothetical protein
MSTTFAGWTLIGAKTAEARLAFRSLQVKVSFAVAGALLKRRSGSGTNRTRKCASSPSMPCSRLRARRCWLRSRA